MYAAFAALTFNISAIFPTSINASSSEIFLEMHIMQRSSNKLRQLENLLELGKTLEIKIHTESNFHRGVLFATISILVVFFFLNLEDFFQFGSKTNVHMLWNGSDFFKFSSKSVIHVFWIGFEYGPNWKKSSRFIWYTCYVRTVRSSLNVESKDISSLKVSRQYIIAATNKVMK